MRRIDKCRGERGGIVTKLAIGLFLVGLSIWLVDASRQFIFLQLLEKGNVLDIEIDHDPIEIKILAFEDQTKYYFDVGSYVLLRSFISGEKGLEENSFKIDKWSVDFPSSPIASADNQCSILSCRQALVVDNLTCDSKAGLSPIKEYTFDQFGRQIEAPPPIKGGCSMHLWTLVNGEKVCFLELPTRSQVPGSRHSFSREEDIYLKCPSKFVWQYADNRSL